jgi:hypothetical protein
MTETEVRTETASDADTDDKLSPTTIVVACMGVLAVVALVLVFVLVFSGRLGGGGGNGNSSAAPVDTSPTSAPSPGSDAFFLQVLHEKDFTFQAQDVNWIRMGRAACADMESGSSWVREIGVLVNQFQFTGEEAGYFIADSVSNYCPDKLNEIPRG